MRTPPSLSSQQHDGLCIIRENYQNAASRFDLKEQIRVCAGLLEHFRDAMLEPHERDLDRLNARTKNPREKKAIIKNLIRVCSESVDHRNTVDFITVGALDRCLAAKQTDKEVSHEHMVPGEVIFEEMFRTPPRESHIADLLEQWSFRALITKEERLALDRTLELKSGLPTNLPPGFGIEFYPFARYEAVRILKENLLPVSTRGDSLLSRYLDVRADFLNSEGVWG